MRVSLALFLLLIIEFSAVGQSKYSSKEVPAKYRISWQTPGTVKPSDTETQKFLTFSEAHFEPEDAFLPRYIQKIALSNADYSFNTTIINAVFEPLTETEVAIIKNPGLITSEIVVKSVVSIAKKQKYGIVSFIPIRKNATSGKYEKLVAFDLDVVPSSANAKSQNRAVHTYASNSVLQSGNWYKIGLIKDGIYKLSYSFFQDLGIDLTTLNPQDIRIYGNGGGMLSELNSVARKDDLVENAIFVQGEGDGVFDPSDYVLFYGKGPNTWNYNAAGCPKFSHTLNLYSDSAYYFVTVDLGAGKRIQAQASSGATPTNLVTSFDDYDFHESDNINFIKSGRNWYGEFFDNIATYNFSFNFPNIDMGSPTTVSTRIASRSLTTTASYSVVSQTGSVNIPIGSTPGDSYSDYAIVGSGCFSFNPNNASVLVSVTKLTSSAVAWLDCIDVNARRQLTMSGDQMAFRDGQSVGSGNISQYTITSSLPVQIWDVTEPTNAFLQNTSSVGSTYQFVLPSDSLKQFVAHNGLSYLTPKISGTVANQDLHALSNKDYIIIAHPDFYSDATQLAAFHETFDTLSTVVVTPQQIYNEFSSGAQDICALRDFVKMFYDRATVANELPQYLLMYGDGSYDNKKRFSNNTNFIPTYQSNNSTILTQSYVSDDFYGLLDDAEGLWSSTDAVDIGIGRFPVKNIAESNVVLKKVIDYNKTGFSPSVVNNGCANLSNDSPFGDWRNIVCFVGDDEDGGLHQIDANRLAIMVDTAANDYNVDKIFLDAYPQESTPGGSRYPTVAEAINKRIEKGCLIWNYTGHGGEVGLSHERVVEVAQINGWNNYNKLPLFVTATCEFSRFDDPDRTSAGEYVLLNSEGGGIALFTTVRLVFASGNFIVNRDLYEQAFTPMASGKMPRLGDLYYHVKTEPGGNSVNSRNFTLLGDPALTLAYPKYDVSTDTVNSIPVSVSSSATLKALSLVTISGFVRSSSGSVLNSYNGVIYPTVYDKSQNITTLSNDAGSPPYTFGVQKNILYKGKASVTNGAFKFSFVVPKDIAYAYGIGRVSYYAENGTEDANGFYEKVIIGGSNDSALTDNAGPNVDLFMNDAKFVFGGLTDETPDLFAILKDENGVNTVGNGIGHDITAVLDANTENTVVLNDYYQADLNSYKSGTIRYPFSELSEGKHTLSLKVWDVYNNSSQSYTEFIVARSAELALSHVLNYPNPFTTKTQFYFEQNQCCQVLDVSVQIFTVSGKLVKSIDQFVQTEGFRSDPIEWDGRDDFGDRIGKGVYIYRIKVKTSEGAVAEKFEKLVILN
ncbi:MAG: type IX secretion system sortase PorU [Bacteroidetes bacterium]|nr:type IX secretion system sortase PorU [Bacteroidota bacterium]